jgi:hypothetical protein
MRIYPVRTCTSAPRLGFKGGVAAKNGRYKVFENTGVMATEVVAY